jgi:hypothetical protein
MKTATLYCEDRGDSSILHMKAAISDGPAEWGICRAVAARIMGEASDHRRYEIGTVFKFVGHTEPVPGGYEVLVQRKHRRRNDGVDVPRYFTVSSVAPTDTWPVFKHCDMALVELFGDQCPGPVVSVWVTGERV